MLSRYKQSAEELLHRLLWKVPFFVIAGGEPPEYQYRSKGILDLAQKHNDALFMTVTKGTLVDEAMARGMAAVGNITPAISLKGMEQKTNDRRG